MNYPHPPLPRKAIKRAGKAIAAGKETSTDLKVVDLWRASHGYVINNFQAWFKKHLAKTEIQADFAQRLKRRKTVVEKLKRRHPDGRLLISDVTTMHDFAGCRLIFDTLDDLHQFRQHMHSKTVTQNIKHKLSGKSEKYNYIDHPKPSGYRGIHDVYRHFPRPHRRGDNSSLPWHGLNVEIQYRTKVQHAWATAVEISDIIDSERTKFELEGGERFKFFSIASEILARHFEDCSFAHCEKTNEELVRELNILEQKLGILERLAALKVLGGFEKLGRHNVLNITRPNDDILLEVHRFRSPKKAIEKANELESDLFSLNAVYVRADNPSQLRSAYRNYFADPEDFVALITKAIFAQNDR